jgi:hypothetical protein
LSVHEIAKTFSKRSASKNEITDRFSDREVVEVLLEGLAWVLGFERMGRRNALRSVKPLRWLGEEHLRGVGKSRPLS